MRRKDREVYIVPLNFGYEVKGDTYIFFFHGAKEGRKNNLIKQKPTVGFELDTNYVLNEADLACGYSARFQSIIGNGVVSIVSEIKEKKLEVTKMSCKEHK